MKVKISALHEIRLMTYAAWKSTDLLMGFSRLFSRLAEDFVSRKSFHSCSTTGLFVSNITAWNLGRLKYWRRFRKSRKKFSHLRFLRLKFLEAEAIFWRMESYEEMEEVRKSDLLRTKIRVFMVFERIFTPIMFCQFPQLSTARAAFAAGKTRPLAFRRQQLEKLWKMLDDKGCRQQIYDAVYKDIKRCNFDGKERFSN